MKLSPWNLVYWAVLVGTLSTLPSRAQPPSRTVKSPPARTAQPEPTPVLTDRPDATELGTDVLGERFESKSLGISLRPPRDMLASRRAGSGDAVEFVDPKRNWTLRLSRIRTNEPTQLLSIRNRDGTPKAGLLESTVKSLSGSLGKVDVLRQDLTNIGVNDVGMLAVRYSKDLQTLLTQQAIIQTSDRLYYLIAFTTPSGARMVGSTTQPGQAAAIDPKEAAAASAFRQVIDSVQLMDLTAIREEQDRRLFSTRALLVNFTPARLQAVLKPKQWYRIVRGGKDYGYTVVVEQSAAGIPTPLTDKERRAGKSQPDVVHGEGVLVASRTWVQAEKGAGLDTESWLFVTPDLRHEEWTTQSVTERAGQKGTMVADHVTELGASDRRKVPTGGDDYSLTVTHITKVGTDQPVTRVLPPFYLPKAIGHLLPRLVPLTQAKVYLFYSYASGERELIAHYVDVLPERRVNFNGQSIRAVQVQEKFGIEGAVTTHFLSPAGEYLGSESKELQTIVLPSSQEELLTVWKDAKMGAPQGVERQPAGAAPAASSPPAATPPAPQSRTAPPLRQQR